MGSDDGLEVRQRWGDRTSTTDGVMNREGTVDSITEGTSFLSGHRHSEAQKQELHNNVILKITSSVVGSLTLSN